MGSEPLKFFMSRLKKSAITSAPFDGHNKRWNTSKGEDFVPYARLSQRYLEKAGLRVVTIWDEVNDAQRQAYADECKYLYGLTIQD